MKLINPHIIIDGVPNYIVIMTLNKRGERGKPFMLAMYSEWPLKADGPRNTGKGFVASVTNRRPFYMVKNDKTARLTEYNQYYIVFGKTELQFIIGKDEL
jgi:hypothetical protein